MAAFASVIAAANGSWMGLALSFWGVVVALSRALLGRHYLGDVCAGAVVGLLNTALITKVCPNESMFFIVPCGRLVQKDNFWRDDANI